MDAHVGETLFNEGIVKFLLGAGKTVILVTHQIHFLKACDNIVILDNGKVIASGSYDHLASSGYNLEAHAVQPSQVIENPPVVGTAQSIQSATKLNPESEDIESDALRESSLAMPMDAEPTE